MAIPSEEFRSAFYREFPSPILTRDEGRIDFAAFWCANAPATIQRPDICGE